MHPQKKQSKTISEQTIHESKWLGLKYITYSIGQKTIPNYEAVYRTTTKNKGHKIDGVQVIPIIKYADPAKTAQIIMIANYRPPANGFALQFPSGLVENADYQQNARREVLEQTGYKIHKFIPIPLPVMYSDPWKSNQSGLIYIGLIDGDGPEHKKQQQLEVQENIIVHKLPLNQNLMENVRKLTQQNKYIMQAKVWCVCIGLAMRNVMGNVGVAL